MGFFDRLIPKKETPPEASTDPNAPAPEGTPSGETPPSAPPSSTPPINMGEANRFLNNAAESINQGARSLAENAKPLGDSLKPLGQSFVTEISNAGRDLSQTFNNLTNSSSPAPSSPTQPEAQPSASTPEGTPPTVPPVDASAPVSPTPAAPSSSTPPASGATQEFEVPQQQVPSTPAPAPAAQPPQPQADDALPLPDEFDPFWAAPETVPLKQPVTTSGEAPSEPVTVNEEPVVIGPAISPTSTASEPEVLSSALDDEGNLEEYSEPLPSLAPAPLESGAQVSILGSDGASVDVTVTQALAPHATINRYQAQSAAGTALLLREAALNSEAAAQLERESTARRAINSPQIPPPAAYGTSGDRVYLADTTGESQKTFASQLQEEAPLADLISTLTQTSAALMGLHRAGFVHGAVRPEAIVLGKPVRLSGFESLSPIGQKSTQTASFAGYGAPEIVAGETLDARTDIYSVGALLHRILTGNGVSETGWDATTFAPQVLLPGAPQILNKTLGPAATRYSDMSALHRDLVRLRARLRPLARHESVGETTIGLEWGRTTNQDAWGELRGHKQGEDGAVEWTAWIVSDGMGGMASGEVASQVSVGAILKEAATWSTSFDGSPLAEADQAQIVKTWTREANRQAVEAMNNVGARGGCTLVCGLIVDKRLTLAHVGDCRVYLWRGGELKQLTRDHSYVMSLVLQGEITREQMRDHPDRSKITRSLGDRHPMPDYFVDGLEVETKVPSLELQADDVLLAFSDGVWEPVVEDAMKAILTSTTSLEEAAHQLVDAAMREGGPDNATVYLFKMNEAAPVVVRQDANLNNITV